MDRRLHQVLTHWQLDIVMQKFVGFVEVCFISCELESMHLWGNYGSWDTKFYLYQCPRKLPNINSQPLGTSWSSQWSNGHSCSNLLRSSRRIATKFIIAMTVQFDSYSGPTLPDGEMAPIVCCITHGCPQKFTLSKAVIDVGKKEFLAGLTFVTCSCIQQLKDLLFVSLFIFSKWPT